ncbi:MAG: hypothetical protein QE277_12235 [Flectobacillus sp.]|nr:hypothetical protein [Flectobacillus sp.]
MIKQLTYSTYYLLLLLATHATTIAQSLNFTNTLTIAVVMPNEASGELNDIQLQRLQDKFVDVLTQKGISSLNIQNNLVLYPIIKIYDEQTINPGLQNITVISAEMSIYIKQLDNKVIFATLTKKLKGSGRTKELALSNLISNANFDDTNTSNFVDKVKEKALAYYKERCSIIIQQADQLTKMNQTQEALGLLLSIPSEVECYQQVQNKTIEVFHAYQNQTCNQLLLNAKAKIANRQFEEGLSLIGMIDPTSVCKADALSTIQQVSQQVEGDNKRKWDLLNKVFVDSAEIEKYRLTLMSQFLIAYALRSNQYNYQNIIR